MHDSYTISTIMTSEGKRHFNILPLLCYYCTHPIFARVDFSKVRIAPVTDGGGLDIERLVCVQ